MKINPNYSGRYPELVYRNGYEVMIYTGFKVPVNACDKCGRADWVNEEFTIEEALEKGILIDDG